MILSQAANTKRKAWKKQRVACAAQRRFRCKPDCVHVRYNHHQTVMISAINIIISPFFCKAMYWSKFYCVCSNTYIILVIFFIMRLKLLFGFIEKDCACFLGFEYRLMICIMPSLMHYQAMLS